MPYGRFVGEGDFIEWWRKNKGVRQTKGRRPAWQERLRDSYFERLFRENGLSGGGNIDGIWFDKNGAIGAVVEIRNTSAEPIETYDPPDTSRQTAIHGLHALSSRVSWASLCI